MKSFWLGDEKEEKKVRRKEKSESISKGNNMGKFFIHRFFDSVVHEIPINSRYDAHIKFLEKKRKQIERSKTIGRQHLKGLFND